MPFFSETINLDERQSNVSMTILLSSWRPLNSSWKHLIDVHLNFIFEYEKNYWAGVTLTRNRLVCHERCCVNQRPVQVLNVCADVLGLGRPTLFSKRALTEKF